MGTIGDGAMRMQAAPPFAGEEESESLKASFPPINHRGGPSRTGRSSGLLAGLLSPRKRPQFALPEAVSLLTFCVLLAWCIPHHESWFDEAQAWLIARDSTLRDLVVHRLHYEGAPVLWHLLLWVEIHLHVSFLGMHYIAGVFAAMGAAVWLRFNRLPRAISLLLPFTYFFLYQYAIVARSYTLAPLLVFLLMALYSNRKSSPLAFCVVAGLLANCSLHMAACAAGLALLYGNDRLRPRLGAAIPLRKMLLPGLLLGLFFVASAATALPTADGSSTTANPIVTGIRSMLPHATAVARTEPATIEDNSADAAKPEPPPQGPLATKLWRLINVEAGASHKAKMTGAIIKHLLVLMTAITVPIATSNLLAACFLGLLLINLTRAHRLLALAPYAFVQVCNTLISGEAHHIGLTWIALVACLWVLALEPVATTGVDQGLQRMLYAVTLLVIVLQVGWSAHSLRADVRGPYSGSQATAAFLSGLPAGTRVAAFDDDSVTVNAYLGRSPYFNQQVEYWPFSKTRNPSLFFDQTMAQRPDMVILKMSSANSPVMNQWVTLVPAGTSFIAQDKVDALVKDHYRETHRFCGSRFYRDSSESTDCRVVFEPSGVLPPP